ncbi:MAG: hypothetical protein HOM14_01545 [Gammaproteobacteria bacterium]|jgi:hypothetical protein|nr:hypothetical protein [Gammaproteobacteria bacterium]MBT3724274.1 hypothetical protein [Gammaproteobacteria bacterium]MBT4076533.1 hypothetical protein [Gammaproteobacteria bacterium]MBT4193477.1 hypothetical protein [Gammaproteobacteria bacterium]MBT4449220.1 hypothetical protein [Gammaproteobacteria bacterium]
MNGILIVKEIFRKNISLLTVVLLLIYIPFIESFSPTLWGLNWNSPLLMDKVGWYLRAVKLFFVSYGLLLFIKWEVQIHELLSVKAIFYLFKVFTFLIGILQIALLSIGFLFFHTGQSLDRKHIEKSYGDFSIYTLTRDVGGLGGSQYFYIKCPKYFGRYQLTFIKKTDWLRDFDSYINDDVLFIKTESDETHQVNLSEYNLCNDK